MKMRKILSLALSCTMVLGIMIPSVSAQDLTPDMEPEVTVVNLSESISTQEVQEIVSSTTAYFTLEDGTTVPVDSVVTIEDAPLTRSALPGQNAYQVTISAAASNEKVVTNANEKNGSVTATAVLSMIWIDNLGFNNVIKEVWGSRVIYVGTEKKGTLIYGNYGSSTVGWTKHIVTGPVEFRFYPNKKVDCPSAKYTVSFNETNSELTVKVTATVRQ